VLNPWTLEEESMTKAIQLSAKIYLMTEGSNEYAKMLEDSVKTEGHCQGCSHWYKKTKRLGNLDTIHQMQQLDSDMASLMVKS